MSRSSSTPPTRPSSPPCAPPGSRWRCTSTGSSGSVPSGACGRRATTAGRRLAAPAGPMPSSPMRSGIVDHLRERAWHPRALHPLRAHPSCAPRPGELAEVGLEAREYHLVVARFEPENHVREIVTGYVSSSLQKPLVVVGDAAYADRYRREILQVGQRDPRVRFLGSVWDQDLLDALYCGAASLRARSLRRRDQSLLAPGDGGRRSRHRLPCGLQRGGRPRERALLHLPGPSGPRVQSGGIRPRFGGFPRARRSLGCRSSATNGRQSPTTTRSSRTNC